ncbi:MAG: hypothetical protein FWD53_01120 [Phycisphaerales bacterium]|nr:hypothetical protein [Phycisphaerales bacterium]
MAKVSRKTNVQRLMLESLESRLMLSAVHEVLASGKPYVYVDANNSVVSITLSGGGTVDLTFPGSATSGMPESVIVTPNGTKDTLKITVKNADKNFKTTTIGVLEIVGSGLKEIKAGMVNLVGDFTMNVGEGAKITFGDIGATGQYVTLNLTGTSSVVTSLKLGHVVGNIQTAGRIDSLVVGTMSGGSIEAGSVGKLEAKGYKEGKVKVAGRLEGDVTLSGVRVAKGKNTLDSVKAEAFSGTLTVTGDVGTLTIKDMAHADVSISGKVKSVKTSTLMGLVPAAGGSLCVTDGGAFTIGKETFKSVVPVAIYPTGANGYMSENLLDTVAGSDIVSYRAKLSDDKSATSVEAAVTVAAGSVRQSYAVGGDERFAMTWSRTASDAVTVTKWFFHSPLADFDITIGNLMLPEHMAYKTKYVNKSDASGTVSLKTGFGIPVTVSLQNATATLTTVLLGHEQVAMSDGTVMLAMKVQYDVVVAGKMTVAGKGGTVSLTSKSTVWIVPGMGVVKVVGSYNESIKVDKLSFKNTNTYELTADPPPEPPEPESAAADWLAALVEQQYKSLYIYKDYADGMNNFTQKVWMCDQSLNELQPPEMDEMADGRNGTTGIVATIDLNTYGWGGYMFVNGVLRPGETVPLADTGAFDAGLNLTGAVAITFYAKGETGNECVDFFVGGLGWENHQKIPDVAYPDSIDKALVSVSLSTEWQQYGILILGKDLSRIANGFGWMVDSANNPDADTVTFYLDDIQYEFATARTTPIFVQSYGTAAPGTTEAKINNFAYTYDNALAAMALSYAGNHEAARRIADALAYAYNHDRTFEDGRLRNVYSCGNPISFPGWQSNKGEEFARMPGFYDPDTKIWLEDVYAASSSTGNMAWAILALCEVCKNDPNAPNYANYLNAAKGIADLIIGELKDTRGDGGFMGGYQGWDEGEPAIVSKKVEYKSTEHNLDLITAFAQLTTLTGNAEYQDASDHAKAFVLAMYDANEGCFYMGTTDDGEAVNKDVLPLDCNTWAILALGQDFATAEGAKIMAFIEATMAMPGGGYDFNEDKDGVWFEGTAQVALAYLYIGDTEKYEQILEYLNQQAELDGSITAADRDGVTSGLYVEGTNIPWLYDKRIHVGATAWLAFAQLGKNPLAC